MKIAVLGGTGRVGKEFIRLALEQGHSIKALVRPQSLENAKLLFGNDSNIEIVKLIDLDNFGHNICSQSNNNLGSSLDHVSPS